MPIKASIREATYVTMTVERRLEIDAKGIRDLLRRVDPALAGDNDTKFEATFRVPPGADFSGAVLSLDQAPLCITITYTREERR